MARHGDSTTARETGVRVVVRYWAAARAAAGTTSDEVTLGYGATLGELLDELRRRHPDDRFARVVGVCSVLVDERPASGRDPLRVVLPPDSHVELLPPFAGG